MLIMERLCKTFKSFNSAIIWSKLHSSTIPVITYYIGNLGEKSLRLCIVHKSNRDGNAIITSFHIAILPQLQKVLLSNSLLTPILRYIKTTTIDNSDNGVKSLKTHPIRHAQIPFESSGYLCSSIEATPAGGSSTEIRWTGFLYEE